LFNPSSLALAVAGNPGTPAGAILDLAPDGILVGNGPGDPSVTSYGIAVARELLGTAPVFGICLGHQLMAHALGGSTYKMKFGHRGANQPVKNLRTGVVEITSHNHGFAVDLAAWDPLPADATPTATGTADADAPGRVNTPFGRVELTHWNLNDGTLEGLRCLDVPAFSVQYHPEAAAGPHDAAPLFQRFVDLMEEQPSA